MSFSKEEANQRKTDQSFFSFRTTTLSLRTSTRQNSKPQVGCSSSTYFLSWEFCHVIHAYFNNSVSEKRYKDDSEDARATQAAYGLVLAKRRTLA